MKKIKYIIVCLLFMIPIMVNAAGNISVSSSNISVDVGGTVTFKVNASNAAGIVKISSNNTSVATVDVSKYFFDTSLNDSSVTVTVRGISKGNTTVSVNLSDVATFDGEELTGTKIVNVTVNEKKIEASSVTLSKTSATIDIGKDVTLTATINPSNTANKTVTWTSSNTKVATVSNGKVVGVSKGTATITAKTSNGKTATCKVTVIGNDNNSSSSSDTKTKVEATGVSLNLKDIEIGVGETKIITATINPTNATNKDITWISSDSKIASVIDGNITGIKEGTVTITAKTNNGKTATCNVLVKQNGVTKGIDIKRFDVVGYNIDFSKEKQEYNIDVLNSVNKLYIIVEADGVDVVGDKDVDITNKDFITVRLSNDTDVKEYKININRIENSKTITKEENGNLLLYILFFFVAMCIILSIIVIKLSLKNKQNRMA